MVSTSDKAVASNTATPATPSLLALAANRVKAPST